MREEIKAGLGIARRDIYGKYAKSKLGILWDFIDPLVLAIVFVGLYKFRVLKVDLGVLPYSMFVLSGMIIWQTFVDTLVDFVNVFRKHINMVKHIRVGPFSLIVSNFTYQLFTAFCRFTILLAFFLYFGVGSFWGFVVYFLVMLLVMIYAAGVGLLLSPFAYILEDISKFVDVSLRPAMFISGVVFPLSNTGIKWLEDINPIASFLTYARGGLAMGEFSISMVNQFHLMILFLLLAGGLFIFRKTYLVILSQ